MSTIQTAGIQQAHAQWMSRPSDQRFTSLDAMQVHMDAIRANSRAAIVPNRILSAIPTPDNQNLVIQGANGHGYEPTHWAFGQLARLAGAPAGYLRTLPAPMVADCLNYGLQIGQDAQDVGALLYRNGGTPTLRAATGPAYGRIWNAEVVAALRARFGNGVDGDWRVPGEFGVALQEVTKDNTTLYASDRDMFVFLADEKNRVEIPNRRDGKTGTLARGFYFWNSEEGNTSLGVSTFFFDFACKNRTIWGGEQYQEMRIRHTSGAPDRFINEVAPALEAYAQSSTRPMLEAIENARNAKIQTDITEFLAKRFTRTVAQAAMAAHVADEGRPIETLWDAANGLTAYARGMQYQDERVNVEREAGKLLDLASA
jgi:hypothetical protein